MHKTPICCTSPTALGDSFIYIRSSTVVVPTEFLKLLLLAKTKWNLTQLATGNEKASREAYIQYVCPTFSNWRKNPEHMYSIIINI